MQKNTLIAFIVTIAIIAGGYYLYSQSKGDKKTDESVNDSVVTEEVVVEDSTATTPEPTPTVSPSPKTTPKPKTGTTGTTPKPGTVSTKYVNVGAALDGGASMRCVVLDGATTNTIYISKGRARKEAVSISNTSYVVMTSTQIFSWLKSNPSNVTTYTGSLYNLERDKMRQISLMNVSCTNQTSISDAFFQRP
jgi:hypothetical protein